MVELARIHDVGSALSRAVCGVAFERISVILSVGSAGSMACLASDPKLHRVRVPTIVEAITIFIADPR
jgi:hypothetical protein